MQKLDELMNGLFKLLSLCMTMLVIITNSYSNPMNVSVGVHQGSVLLLWKPCPLSSELVAHGGYCMLMTLLL